MKVPISKLKAILLYFANFTDPKFLGVTKLLKLIYFLDFIHLKTYGTPVTYDTYINLEHGPIPTTIKNLIDSARNDIDNSLLADTISIEHLENYEMWRVTAKRKFTEKESKYFSDTELKVLEKVINRFGDKNTSFVENASHKEAPWSMTRELEEIPYTLAVHDKDCLVTKEEIELSTQIL